MGTNSRLKKYQSTPTNLLGTALHLFRSTGTQTAVVEGLTDKRFLSQWSKPDKIRFAGFEGKPHVEEVYRESKKHPYSAHDFLYFFADIDYDEVDRKPLVLDPRFIYNAYCNQKNAVEFNDLETFLINSSAFEKLLANHDIDTREATDLRVKLEVASRLIGALRAADLSLVRKLKLSSSVLNGIEIEPFFRANDVTIDTEALHSRLPYWSNRREYVEDLIDEAAKINAEKPNLWALSRGHDLTEMLTLYLQGQGHPTARQDKLELMLRLACDYRVFKDSAMGRKLETESFHDFLQE